MLSKMCLPALAVMGIVLSYANPVRAEAQSDPPALSPLKLGFFADTYYGYDFNNPLSQTRDFTTQPARHNEFNLNLAVIDGRYNTDNFRARLALQTGTYVAANYAAEPILSQVIHEVSAGVKLNEGLWLDAGIMPSHIGLESAISKDNINYTRSLMADNTPYYETGVRLSAAFSDQLSGQVLVLNGWQNIKETNNSKALGTQLQFKPWDNVLLNWSTFLGNEKPDDKPVQIRLHNNLYGTWAVTSQLDVALLFDLCLEQRAKASDGWATLPAVALQGRYKFTPQLAIGARVEHYNDREQMIVSSKTPNGFQVTSASLNVDYQLTENLLWRTEGRFFYSVDPIYQTGVKDSLSQTSGLLVTSLSSWF